MYIIDTLVTLFLSTFTMLSDIHTVEFQNTVDNYFKENDITDVITQSNLILQYNTFMNHPMEEDNEKEDDLVQTTFFDTIDFNKVDMEYDIWTPLFLDKVREVGEPTVPLGGLTPTPPSLSSPDEHICIHIYMHGSSTNPHRNSSMQAKDS